MSSCPLAQDPRRAREFRIRLGHVRRATRTIVGYPCNPNTLRKTAAVYFADRVGAGILSRLGWDAQQAFAYSWMTREVLNPIDPL